jgi:hypothetical protein
MSQVTRNETRLPSSWRARPRGFAALMSIYESNYLRLTRLTGDPSRLRGECVSRVPGACDLRLSVLEQCPYTTTLGLTHLFHDPAAVAPRHETLLTYPDHCIQNKAPLVCFSSSGGARMQEALFSLLQMAKTSAALARLAQARLPFISVLTDPTTGGVSASLAMLGDLNVAEPRALIGFAGPRVIQQTVRETLPEGFQRSEFLLDHGALDFIVDRRDMRERLGSVLRMLMRQPAAVAQPAAVPAG